MCTSSNNRNIIKSKRDKMISLSLLPLNFTPGTKDILCGRGNVFSNHEGNRCFGRVIRANLKEYMNASSRPKKIVVVNNILQDIRSDGIRFAKLDSETKRWYELSDVLAHQKIGHAIRDTIRLLKDKTKNTKATTTNLPKFPNRKRKMSALKQRNVQPSSDIRIKELDDILQMSIEASECLNDIWSASKNVQPQFRPKAEFIKAKIEIPQPYYNHEKKFRFHLKDEYPEEKFDFSAGTFFNFNARPNRITSN